MRQAPKTKRGIKKETNIPMPMYLLPLALNNIIPPIPNIAYITIEDNKKDDLKKDRKFDMNPKDI